MNSLLRIPKNFKRVLIPLFFVLLLFSFVSASGIIHVIVRDQENKIISVGKIFNGTEEIDSSEIPDFELLVLYNGEKIFYSPYSNKEGDTEYIAVDVPHPGTYLVRARTIVQAEWPHDFTVSVNWSGTPSGTPLDWLNESQKEELGVWSPCIISGTPSDYTVEYCIGFDLWGKFELIDVDWIPPTGAETTCNVSFKKRYTYFSTNSVFTHVGENETEPDVVKVVLERDPKKLRKVPALSSPDFLGLNSRINANLLTDNDLFVKKEYSNEKPIRIAGEEGAEWLLEEYVLKGFPAASYCAELTVNAVGKYLEDRDSLLESETLINLAATSVAAVLAEKALMYLGVGLGFSPTGPWAIVAIAGSVVAEETVDEIVDEAMYGNICDNTKSDDLEFLIGEVKDYDEGYDYRSEFELMVINKGSSLHNVYVGEQETDYKTVWYLSRSNKIKVINAEEIGKLNVVWIHPKWEKIRDKLFIIYESEPSLFQEKCPHVHSLHNYERETPLITEVSFPKFAYPNGTITVSARILDNDGVKENGNFVLWDGTQSYLLKGEDGDKFDAYYKAQFKPSINQDYQDGDIIEFEIHAFDHENETVNNNYGEMFGIQVIEDALGGGDAPPGPEGAFDISGFTDGKQLNGYLNVVPEDNDDWYKFSVQKGQKVKVGVESDRYVRVNLLYDYPLSTGQLWTGEAANSVLIQSNEETVLEDGSFVLAFSTIDSLSGTGLVSYSFNVEVYGVPRPDPPDEYGDHDFEQVVLDDAEVGYVGAVPQLDKRAMIVRVDNQKVEPGAIINVEKLQPKPCSGEDSGLYIAINDVYFNYDPRFAATYGDLQACLVDESGNFECSCAIAPQQNCDPARCPPELHGKNLKIKTKGKGQSSGEYTYRCCGAFYAPADEISNNEFYDIVIGRYKGGEWTRESQDVGIDPNIDFPPEIGKISAEVSFNNVAVRVTASDKFENLDYIEIYANNNSIHFDDSLIGKDLDYTFNWDTSELTQGVTYTIYGEVGDGSGNWAETERVEVTLLVDTEAPIIDSLSILPTENGGVYRDWVRGEVQLFASVREDGSGIRNIFWLKGSNQLGEGEIVNWSTSGFGSSVIRIWAEDNLGNTSPEKWWVINFDNGGPSISNVSPSSGAEIGYSADLSADTVDYDVGLWKTEWFLLVAGEWQKIAAGKRTKWYPGAVSGSQTIKVVATDMVGNTSEQQIPVYVLEKPDLVVKEILISPADPMDGEKTNISVIIENEGEMDSDDFNVLLRIDGGSLGVEPAELGSGDVHIMVIDYTPSRKAVFSWTATKGTHSIEAIADPENSLGESDESNNYLSTEITVTDSLTVIDTFSDGSIEKKLEFQEPGSRELFIEMPGHWEVLDANLLLEAVFDIEGSWQFESIESNPGPKVEFFTDEGLGITYSSTRKTFEIPLSIGWNMISIPLYPEDAKIESVLSSISGKFDAVLSYENGSYQSYLVGAPSQFHEMVPGKGYWINMTFEGILEIEGFEMVRMEKRLLPGDNLVGYPFLEKKSISEALESISGKYNSLFHYDSGWEYHLVGGSSTFSEVSPGEGYWLNVSEECTWTIENESASGLGITGVEEEPTFAVYQYLGTTKPVLEALSGMENDFTAVYYDYGNGKWYTYFNPLTYTGPDWNALRIGYELNDRWFDELEQGGIYFIHFIGNPKSHPLLYDFHGCAYYDGFWYNAFIENGGPEIFRCEQGCEDSACVPFEVSPPTCIDSDNGRPEVKGTAVFEGQQYEDYCLDGSTLLEYSCSGGVLEQRVLKASCTHGAAYFSRVSIDVGADGTEEWSDGNFSGSIFLNSGNTIPSIAAEIEAYRQSNCVGALNCTVPIRFAVSSPGSLKISKLNILEVC